MKKITTLINLGAKTRKLRKKIGKEKKEEKKQEKLVRESKRQRVNGRRGGEREKQNKTLKLPITRMKGNQHDIEDILI